MPFEKIAKLDEQAREMQTSIIRIETMLAIIVKNTETLTQTRDIVTKHVEKHAVTENRLKELEIEGKERSKNINSINLKIAGATGAWAVIMFIIDKM